MLRFAACATLMLWTAAPGFAQDTATTNALVGQANAPLGVRPLRSVEDIDVRSADGDRLGEVEEVLIDARGRPAAFLVELGGFLDFDDDEVAVPLDALTWDGEGFVSNLSKDELAQLRPWED